jgi:hypothetical protein
MIMASRLKDVLAGVLPQTLDEFLDLRGINAAEYHANVARELDADARLARRERLIASGVAGGKHPRVKPEILVRIVDDTLDDTQALRTVRLWLDIARGQRASKSGKRPTVLVLSASVGVGKTVAAAYALAQIGGHHVLAPKLVERMQPRNPREQATALPAHAGRLFVVDDIGTESGREFGSVFFDVIDSRVHSRATLTLITTNLSEHDFCKRYDLRTMDRLREHGSFVEFQGASLRK